MDFSLPSNVEPEQVAVFDSEERVLLARYHDHPNERVTAALHAEASLEAAFPPSGNTGGKFQRSTPQIGEEHCRTVLGSCVRPIIEAVPLPRGEVPPSAALTDWLNVSFPFAGTPQAIAELVQGVNEHLSPKFGGLVDRGKGLHGFIHSFAFDEAHSMFAYGGQRGKGFLSFPAEGCALIPDWERAYYYLKDCLDARVCRWDGAVDDFEGRYTVDIALTWFLSDQFNTHGNQPRMKQVGNWACPDGTGRTLYIGKRENGKMLRIYEKGKQLGDTNSPWVRWELELKSKDRVIPLEVLIRPGPYVAGSYACLDWIDKEACRVRTIQKTAQISYEHLTHYLSVAYGKHLNIMEEVEGSAEAVMAKLKRPGMPKRLQLPNVDPSLTGA